MTMERWIEGHRNNPAAVAKGKALLEEFGETPLRGKLTQESYSKFEAITTPLSPEAQRLVEHMQKDGYVVYEAFGKSPSQVKSEGMKFWYLNPKLENVTAAPALLAFQKKPSEFFLPGSQGISHDEQVKLLSKEQVRVDAKYPGAGLIVREGKLPEWTEIALKHFKATKVRILGRDYGYNYTWTDTYESEQGGARRAGFGHWDGTNGALAFLWYPDDVDSDLRLAPLVEISRK